MKLEECKAVILMAAYQGEKYIGRQLDSIIGQTFTNWTLYISDDGSYDGTLNILQKYKARDSRIAEIIVNTGEHGAFGNFFHLMRYLQSKSDTTFDFYFYSDQDDIWYAEKMEKQIKRMLAWKEQSSFHKPVLCYSDLQLMDGDGCLLGSTLGQKTDISLDNPYNIFFAERYIWGTTMAHDAALWNMLSIPANIPPFLSHDNFVGRYAAAYGRIVFMNEPLVYYRRHGGNVTADVPHGYSFWQGIRRAFTKLPEVIGNHAGSYWASLYFIAHTHDKTRILADLETCLQSGGLQAVRIAKKYHINTADNFFNKAAFFLILFTGVYKLTRIFKRDFRQ